MFQLFRPCFPGSRLGCASLILASASNLLGKCAKRLWKMPLPRLATSIYQSAAQFGMLHMRKPRAVQP